MKKIFVAAVAVAIVALSAVSAFALDVESPVATTQPDTQATTTSVQKDNTPVSPKTGSADVAAYSAIALSVIACGAASVALAKAKK